MITTKRFVLGFSTINVMLFVLIISYISYIEFIDLQIITSNSLISDKAVTVIFKDDNTPDIKKLLSSYPDITLFAKLYYNPEMQVWGLCSNYNLDNKINKLIKGSFFRKSKFFKNDFKAVVGKNVLNSNSCFEDEEGKRFFEFINSNYEVIGYIHSDISNMLDNTAFVNLDSFDVKFNRLIIDGLSKQCIDTAIKSIQNDYNVNIVKEDNSNFIQRYLFNDTDKQILNTLIIIFIIVLILLLSVFTLYYYNEEIKVMRILGISFKRILFDLFKNIIALMIVNTTFLITIYSIAYYSFLKNIHLSFNIFPSILLFISILVFIGLAIYLFMLLSNKSFYKNGVK